MNNGWIALAVVGVVALVVGVVLFLRRKKRSDRDKTISEVREMRVLVASFEGDLLENEPMLTEVDPDRLQKMLDEEEEPAAVTPKELLADELPQVRHSSSHIVGVTDSGISLEGESDDAAIRERFLLGDVLDDGVITSDFAGEEDDGLGPYVYDFSNAEDRARFQKRHPHVTEEQMQRFANDSVMDATPEQIDRLLGDIAAAGEGGNALGDDDDCGPRLYQEDQGSNGDDGSDDSIGDRPTAG